MRPIIPRCLGAALLAGLLLTGCGPQPPQTVRVMTYNIHHGAGMDGQIDLDRIAAVIRDTEADLVSLQEVDRGVARSGGVDQPAVLAELTGLQVVFEMNIAIEGGAYGNAILSRYPIESHENHFLPRMQQNEQRGLLEARVRVGKRPLVFCATHLDYRPDDSERVASVTLLERLLEPHAQTPVIVAGDLNAEPDSRVIRGATAFLADPMGGQESEQFTFPAEYPHRRIDYILHNGHPALRCTDYMVIGEAVASDHRPVLAVFELARDPTPSE
jgi:endonuclease/exonuclease/phosphatase family metal-dependent hydrolase